MSSNPTKASIVVSPHASVVVSPLGNAKDNTPPTVAVDIGQLGGRSVSKQPPQTDTTAVARASAPALNTSLTIASA